MVTEIELKYSLLNSKYPAATEQIISNINWLLTENNLGFSYYIKQLSNHYFDTNSLALRHQKIALRTRGTQCDGDVELFEQTIKTSGRVTAGLHQRPEYNVDIDNDKPILALFPSSIWQETTDLNQLQQDIIELFSTNFTRHTWLITLDNTQVELAFDSGEIACQGFDIKTSIYEIELELLTGDTKDLFSLTQLLFSKLALRPGQLTKAARGYALYHESQVQDQSTVIKQVQSRNNTTMLAHPNKNTAIEQRSLLAISIAKNKSLFEAFKEGIDFCLTELQLSIDSYVSVPSLQSLSQVSEILALLRQGFWLFNDLLTDNEIRLRNELSYFLRTIRWVDNAGYIKALMSKQSRYPEETSVNQRIIAKLQLVSKHYPCESQVLSLLHSERFNNLQLDLLAFILNEKSSNEYEVCNTPLLVEFASNHLTQSSKQLTRELVNLQNTECFCSAKFYQTADALLKRALLTTSWFSPLFVEQDSDIANKFSMPWLELKQGISELQFITLLQEELLHLPSQEIELSAWLANQSDNLITELEQSKAKALSLKGYWY